MTLTEKYKELVDVALNNNLSVNDTGKVLRIEGEVATASIKNKLWEIYQHIDPQFKNNDVILNVKSKISAGDKVKVVTRVKIFNHLLPKISTPLLLTNLHHPLIPVCSLNHHITFSY
jgi:hypothetical protein